MTIHKSKGLEFPVVIIAGMDKKRNIKSSSEMIRTSEKMGIGIDIIDDILKYKYPSIYKEIIGLEKTKEEKEEELRILYVAMTRAKEKLIMTAKVKSVEKLLQKLNESVKLNIYNNKLSSKYIMSIDTYLETIMISLIEAYNTQKVGKTLQINKDMKDFLIYNKSVEDIIKINEKSDIEIGNIYIENTENLTTDIDRENIINIELKEEKENDLKEEYIKISEREFGNNKKEDDEYSNIYKYERDNIDKDIQKILEEKYHDYLEEEKQKEKNIKEYGEDYLNKIYDKISVSSITTLENSRDSEIDEDIKIAYDKPKFLRKTKKNVIEGKERGTIIHSILELFEIVPYSKLLNLKDRDKEEIIKKFLNNLEINDIYTKEELEIVDINILKDYMDTNIYKYLSKSIEENSNIKTYKEKTIYLKLDKKDIEILEIKYGLKEQLEEGQILQGVLDLYIVDEDKREIYIVDYKTDKILNEEYYKERYNIQIGIYEYSIFKQYGQDYKYNKIIYSTTMKKIIRL
jgi:ATP-dependent helicase/nuclease subunit A